MLPSRPAKQSQSLCRGFTLIEIMIVVAIVGILAAVAVPWYGTYIQRGKVPEATSNLSDLRTKMEQYYYDNRQYPAGCTALPTVAPAGNIQLPAAGAFAYDCPALNANAYTIRATGTAARNMTGFVYTIDQANTQASTVPAKWGGGSPTCWYTKPQHCT
jgi:type IV pilus assembly protein PilE